MGGEVGATCVELLHVAHATHVLVADRQAADVGRAVDVDLRFRARRRRGDIGEITALNRDERTGPDPDRFNG
ncbi:hypothetical protein [Streptomyces sp. LN325]|uniref:hypothetical protein n=1 Tax=Streptomyces sp. LN325 TaxID=3112976 RepID=UPI003713251B